jgi:hypothetical protein
MPFCSRPELVTAVYNYKIQDWRLTFTIYIFRITIYELTKLPGILHFKVKFVLWYLILWRWNVDSTNLFCYLIHFIDYDCKENFSGFSTRSWNGQITGQPQTLDFRTRAALDSKGYGHARPDLLRQVGILTTILSRTPDRTYSTCNYRVHD